MDIKEEKNQIPFIIGNGIIYNLRDIQKLLKDISHVHYFYYVNDVLISDGEGYILSVVANNTSGNIIVNNRIYINVNGFDYLKISTSQVDNTVSYDLVNGQNILRLIPINDELPNKIHRLTSGINFYDEQYDEEQEYEEEMSWLEDENEEI